MKPEVVVIGASGFIGSAVVGALGQRGSIVRSVVAPRVESFARNLSDLHADVESLRWTGIVEDLRGGLAGADTVVNAAGLAAPVSGDGDALFGANALLPGLVARALSGARCRLVHVSSAAVQGRTPRLTEDHRVSPFSPYSLSKVLGEEVLRHEGRAVAFRPTSVHGANRSSTGLLKRLCASPLASVAGDGTAMTPQVLAPNVGDAIAFVAITAESPPKVVLQPSEGLTVGRLVRLLGNREPRHVPRAVAHRVVAGSYAVGGVAGPIAGLARRLEMLWFGQEQDDGWLSGRWKAPVGHDGWLEL